MLRRFQERWLSSRTFRLRPNQGDNKSFPFPWLSCRGRALVHRTQYWRCACYICRYCRSSNENYRFKSASCQDFHTIKGSASLVPFFSQLTCLPSATSNGRTSCALYLYVVTGYYHETEQLQISFNQMWKESFLPCHFAITGCRNALLPDNVKPLYLICSTCTAREVPISASSFSLRFRARACRAASH